MYFHLIIIFSPWKMAGHFLWTNLNPLHPRMLCAKFGWNWLSGSGEEDFLNFDYVFSLFHNYLPLAGPFIWTNLNPLQLGIHCAKFGWNWLSGSGEEDFFNFVNEFLLFRNYLPLEKVEPFIWTNLNPLHSRMLCAKFGSFNFKCPSPKDA